MNFKSNYYIMKTLNNLSRQLTKTFPLIVILIILVPTACNKDDDIEEPATAPDLPPTASFIMDYSDFTDADTTKYKSTLSYHNWGFAATHFTVWNFVLTVTMIVPLAAFY